jgi:hypothetical protein
MSHLSFKGFKSKKAGVLLKNSETRARLLQKIQTHCTHHHLLCAEWYKYEPSLCSKGEAKIVFLSLSFVEGRPQQSKVVVVVAKSSG